MLENILANMPMLLTTDDNLVIPAEDVLAAAAPVQSGPSAIVIALSVLMAAACIAMIVIVLMQKKRASGIGAALSGTGETYWSKNKASSPEGRLELMTRVCGGVLIVAGLLVNLLVR